MKLTDDEMRDCWAELNARPKEWFRKNFDKEGREMADAYVGEKGFQRTLRMHNWVNEMQERWGDEFSNS